MDGREFPLVVNRDRKINSVFRSLIPDITERPVQAGHTSQSQQRSHQQETGAAQMVGQFLPEQDKESVDRAIFLFPMHAGQGS